MDPAARNLLDYLALRRRDIRDLQAELAGLGLSSLGRCEASVRQTLSRVLTILRPGGSSAGTSAMPRCGGRLRINMTVPTPWPATPLACSGCLPIPGTLRSS